MLDDPWLAATYACVALGIIFRAAKWLASGIE